MSLDDDTRGQAFTLEGLVAGLILLSALLFSLQAVVVTPGAPGADVEPEIRQQTVDTLDIAQQDGNLSYMLRYFNDSAPDDESVTFAHAQNPAVGYGDSIPDDPPRFLELIETVFQDRGKVVNVLVESSRGNDSFGTQTERLIYRGAPPSASTVASTTVTLYSDQKLTGPDGNGTTLGEASATGDYPIENVDPDEPLHNVVHVRVVVW